MESYKDRPVEDESAARKGPHDFTHLSNTASRPSPKLLKHSSNAPLNLYQRRIHNTMKLSPSLLALSLGLAAASLVAAQKADQPLDTGKATGSGSNQGSNSNQGSGSGSGTGTNTNTKTPTTLGGSNGDTKYAADTGDSGTLGGAEKLKATPIDRIIDGYVGKFGDCRAEARGRVSRTLAMHIHSPCNRVAL